MPTENELYDKINRVTSQILKTTDPEARARMTGELATLGERLPKRRTRAAEFDCEGLNDPPGTGSRGFRRYVDEPARTDEARAFARFNDELVILGKMLKTDP